MEEELRALLLGASTVTAICGTRINFGAHPQGQSLPAIVLNTVGDFQGVTISAPEGHSEARVQVDCYGANYGSAKNLYRAVRGVLTGYAGGAIQGVFESSARDSREGDSIDDDRPFRTSADFTVFYNLT